MTPSRRGFLRLSGRTFAGTSAAAVGLASGATAGLAGCLGDPEPALPDHPAAADLDTQPRLGPSPGRSESTIVAFEDPSCPVCRSHTTRAFPAIRDEWVEAGTATYVSRLVPAARMWGPLAIQALESTFAADPGTYWALLAHYYAIQPAVSAETLFGTTRTFLEGRDGIDADAVVRDALRKGQDEAVQLDATAAEGADVAGTPTFVLFRDGEHRTTLAGAQAFAVFETALEG